ncbi:hypothetical protein ACQKGL_29430 [Ensifer adhaerens]|uniref:hypothetical protein n=1 Tax=Ensifer adhaerens TaxID=106592 RepID=UPI003D040BC5
MLKVSLALVRFQGPIFEKRLAVALRVFKRKMNKLGASIVEGAPHIATFPRTGTSLKNALAKIQSIDLRLIEVVETPLPPRQVEKSLQISSRERLKWMKDGRLPCCERRRSGRGQNVYSVPFYDAGLVNELAGSADVIGTWRMDDEELAAATHASI